MVLRPDRSPYRIRYIIAGDLRGGSQCEVAPDLPFQSILKIGTEREVAADEAGFVGPVAGRQRYAVPSHDIERRQRGARVERRQLAVHPVDQRNVAWCGEQ